MHIHLSGKTLILQRDPPPRPSINVGSHSIHLTLSIYQLSTPQIKALSNQKFRDFSLKYGSENVGLITGDMVCMVRL